MMMNDKDDVSAEDMYNDRYEYLFETINNENPEAIEWLVDKAKRMPIEDILTTYRDHKYMEVLRPLLLQKLEDEGKDISMYKDNNY